MCPLSISAASRLPLCTAFAGATGSQLAAVSVLGLVPVKTSADHKLPRLARCLALLAMLVALACFGGRADAAVTGDNPCPTSASNSLSWMGASVGQDFTIPSLRHQADSSQVPATYPMTVLRPADTVTYPGPRPVVVFQHGLGGNRCALWWAAQYLAGHGFVTTVHRSLPGNEQTASDAYRSGVDAVRSVIAYLKGLQVSDPNLGPMIDLGRLGLSGHSMGSIISSQLQGDPSLGIKAIVAFDTLRRYVQGDPGAARIDCQSDPVPATQVTPSVPALSFAMDEPCAYKPDFKPADLKLSGPRWWSEHGVPNMQLVMKGYPHGGFTDGASADKKLDLAHWVLPWFERWLNGDKSQEQLLAAPIVNGRPVVDLLSSEFLSSACLDGIADSEDLRSWFDAGSPATSGAGRCDSPPGQSPDPAHPAPALTNRKLVKLVRLSSSRGWVRAGGKARLKLRITVKGMGQPVKNLNLLVSSSNRRVRVAGTRKVQRINPASTRVVVLTVRAGRKARNKVRVKVTVAGRTVGRTLRIRR